MNKRIVILHNKATGTKTPFATVSVLVRRVGEENIGIGIGALYNALCLNGGRYENEQVVIYYEKTDITTDSWE